MHIMLLAFIICLRFLLNQRWWFQRSFWIGLRLHIHRLILPPVPTNFVWMSHSIIKKDHICIITVAKSGCSCIFCLFCIFSPITITNFDLAKTWSRLKHSTIVCCCSLYIINHFVSFSSLGTESGCFFNNLICFSLTGVTNGTTFIWCWANLVFEECV